jgi:hypothetical protein
MKSLANLDDQQEILQRLRGIGPASRRRWGKMTVPQMICHLSDAFRVSMGEKEAKPVSNWFSRSAFKWMGLWLPVPWPHGVSTVPECEAGVGGTPSVEIEGDLMELRELFDRFTRQPRTFAWQPHPIFGRMSDAEWLRWGYLHMDHHLRQLGA